uniref:Uncharacterized protein n=1 Tax=viral metagenome TaxID=1070528 RepID=A0A6C0DUW6_9ZZZZ
MSVELKEDIVVLCPHCNLCILIEKLNCRIFRHGIIKKTGKQMDPHAPKDICDEYIKHDDIYGCGKPFMIIEHENGFTAIVCDYI